MLVADWMPAFKQSEPHRVRRRSLVAATAGVAAARQGESNLNSTTVTLLPPNQRLSRPGRRPTSRSFGRNGPARHRPPSNRFQALAYAPAPPRVATTLSAKHRQRMSPLSSLSPWNRSSITTRPAMFHEPEHMFLQPLMGRVASDDTVKRLPRTLLVALGICS
ncbi:hypothetical protein QC764_107937 [Podospora pseudoanserina]|uniref:Uncharacterized protein n=1 Tax=Podospora pseudoanserina TaxID=2609844 RepID=A0ABR0INZ8_9PEZI|nr:hypothetical protein QC764_107937 [Podospora pseudoanserina]